MPPLPHPSPLHLSPKLQISEIKGIKLDRDVTVVAFKDGRTLELPAGAATYDGDKVCVCRGGWFVRAASLCGLRRAARAEGLPLAAC